jgi:hypothetical protein
MPAVSRFETRWRAISVASRSESAGGAVTLRETVSLDCRLAMLRSRWTQPLVAPSEVAAAAPSNWRLVTFAVAVSILLCTVLTP